MVLQTVAAGICAGGIGFPSVFPTVGGQRRGGGGGGLSLILNNLGKASSDCIKINLWKKQPANKMPKHVVKAEQDERRSAGYKPTAWDPELILSFTTGYKYEEEHAARIEQLKQDTAKSFLESAATCAPKLIDDIQRLGLRDHFDKEIKDALNNLHSSGVFFPDLYTASLQFRLLRQNGFPINSDHVFNKFLDQDGEFMDNLKEDAKGLLSLYEASYLDLKGEDILVKARNFSSYHLKSLSFENLEPNLSQQIQRSLESPLHHRLPWVEARNFINIYHLDTSRNSSLLELAKLNYNMVQSNYLEELKELARWWKDLNFNKIYPFCRDRLVECYFFTTAFVPCLKLSKCRKIIAKWVTLVTVLDDIYDVHGLLDELEKLTEAFRRFDLKAMEDIPEYMRPCYLKLYENTMEMEELTSNTSGIDILLPHFKKNCTIFVEGYMKEAQWFYGGYMPTSDEYLENGIITIGSPLTATAALLGYLGRDDMGPTEQLVQWIQRPDSDFLRLHGIIGRLLDDLQSSKAEMERGEVVNSITCYMVQEGVSEEEARNQLKRIVSETWTKLNDLTVSKALPATLSDVALNGARCWAEIYNNGDWFAAEGLPAHKSSIISSFFKPIM